MKDVLFIALLITSVLCQTVVIKVVTPQGRGRYFLREALQNKQLVNILDLLADHASLMLVRHECVDIVDFK
jgi:hypothetical protein